jgi:hypothetical protein
MTYEKGAPPDRNGRRAQNERLGETTLDLNTKPAQDRQARIDGLFFSILDIAEELEDAATALRFAAQHRDRAFVVLCVRRLTALCKILLVEAGRLVNVWPPKATP